MPAPNGFPYRTIDGSGNNENNGDWGSAGTRFLRKAAADYGDGVSTPAGDDRPSARAVSNAIFDQDESKPSAAGTSDYFWLWGQFVDHDIDLTAGPTSPESFNIAVPTGDPFFDPFNSGTQVIELERSGFDPTSGGDASDPREQVNEITSFLDASMVYGSDATREAFLRDAGGKLKVSGGDLLPFNDGTIPDAGGPSGFVAGDVRANENNALTSMHTLFVREHNRLVDELAEQHPAWDAETLYQEAKAIVEAQIQAITFNEFLPILVGKDAIEAYDGYDSSIDPSIANIFATAAYRVGHTMLSSQLLRMDESGATSEHGDLALRDAFFRPDRILNEGGIDPLLRGLAAQTSQEIDTLMVDDVRNFLFGPPGAGGFDLASLNIQRGRDHGLPSYNEAREAYGLDKVTSFAQITSDLEIQQALASVYDTVDDIDVFVGGLAEDHAPGAVVGELFQAILVDQFTRLRDGDRFWYEERLPEDLVEEINETKLSDIILRNSDVEYIQENVFLAYNRIGGSDGNERMSGTWGRDLMMGEGGRDRLYGKKGDDEIHAGRGNDRAYGGDGNDKLVGEEGSDRLYGGDGNDRLYGGDGRDRAYGGDDDDKLFGGDDDDRLYGGNGDDMIFGGAGSDRLYGGGGNDMLDGGAAADRLYGGSGENTFVIGDILDFGDRIYGFDSLDDILDLSGVAGLDAGDVTLQDSGGKTKVYVEVGGATHLAATLYSVDAGDLSVGEDPGNNIIV